MSPGLRFHRNIWLCIFTLTACRSENDDPGGGSGYGSASETSNGTTSEGSSTGEGTATGDVTDTGGGSGSEEDSGSGSAGGSGESGAGFEPVVIDCGTPPIGAARANYQHQVTATGGTNTFTWTATGLPMGLAINPVTGSITGASEQSGTFDAELTAQDGQNPPEIATQICTIELGDALSFDLGMSAMPCIVTGQSLTDFVTGGDGSPITCSVPGGNGNGTMPAGVDVDPATCEITGTVQDTRYGTWVWIVEAGQSGYDLHVPYCATQGVLPMDSYGIEADHSGNTNNLLVPATASYDPAAELVWDGTADPLFRITGPCGTGCYYAFAYEVTASPFGSCAVPPCYGLAPATLLKDMNDDPIGFTHELFAKGPAPGDAWSERAWVLSWELDYCISDMPCEVADGQGRAMFGLIMRPQG